MFARASLQASLATSAVTRIGRRSAWQRTHTCCPLGHVRPSEFETDPGCDGSRVGTVDALSQASLCSWRWPMGVGMKLLCLCVFAASSVGCLRGFAFDTPCDGVDCDDGSVCTSDRCTFDFSLNTTCHHDATSDESECGFDGVTLVCREGLCGAESLCAGVNCNDDNPCTVDACDWDGMCSFTPVECRDRNDCTDGRCDPETGACVFEPGEGIGGFCFPQDSAGDRQLSELGECAEGVCTAPCDSAAAEPSECPLLGPNFSCCPGSEYCRGDCTMNAVPTVLAR